MRIRIGFKITLACDPRTPLLLSLHPFPDEELRLLRPNVIGSDPMTVSSTFLDEFGNRRTRMIAGPAPVTLEYDSVVEDSGAPDPVIQDAPEHPVQELPPEVLRFLLPSRYCQSDLLSNDAWRLFGSAAPGWARVQAICDFVHKHITFGYLSARPTMTAVDAFHERNGVCRDFAHLAIALCRAMNIPARYASGYLGDIGVPPAGAGDFSAWFEAYLGGRWHTFDARHNVPRIGRVLMVRGRDAADAAMITSFGNCVLSYFEVWTDEMNEADSFAEDAPLAPRVGFPIVYSTPDPRGPQWLSHSSHSS